MRSTLFVAAALVACGGRSPSASAPHDVPVPASFSGHETPPGEWIQPAIETFDLQAPPEHPGKLVRVWSIPNGYGLFVFDETGRVASAAIQGLRLLPFSGPVRALVAQYSMGTISTSAVLASGEVEVLSGHERRRYQLEQPMTAAFGLCFQPGDRQPLACYHPNTPRLRREGTFGPPSPAELVALARAPMPELLAWRKAGGTLAEQALQIDGERGGTDPRVPGLMVAHVCGVLTDHTVACWGTSAFGELGDGKRERTARFVRVPGLTDVDEVATGSSHTCARVHDGRVACWGEASHHEFPAVAPSSVATCPLDREASARATADRRRRAHESADACMRSDCSPGTLDCHLGCVYQEPPQQLVYDHHAPCAEPRDGRGSVAVVDRPQFLTGVTDAVSLAAGGHSTCIVHATGQLECWDEAYTHWTQK